MRMTHTSIPSERRNHKNTRLPIVYWDHHPPSLLTLPFNLHQHPPPTHSHRRKSFQSLPSPLTIIPLRLQIPRHLTLDAINMSALPAPHIEFLRRIIHVFATATPPGGDVVLVGRDAGAGEVEFLGPALVAPVVGIGGHLG